MYDSSKSKQPFRPQRNEHRGLFEHLGNVIGWIVFFGLALLVVLLALETLGIRF